MKVLVKVGIAVNFNGTVIAFGRGEKDLPPSQAKYLIDKGHAVSIEEKKPKEKPVTVQEVKAETRPVRKKVVK